MIHTNSGNVGLDSSGALTSSQREGRDFLTPKKTCKNQQNYPARIDTFVLRSGSIDSFGSITEMKLRKEILSILSEDFGELNQNYCSIRKGQAWFDSSKYVRFWVGKIAHNQRLFEIGFTGRFFNVARDLDGVNCLEIVQKVYNSFYQNETIQEITKGELDLYVGQCDICSDYLGVTVDQMAQNFLSKRTGSNPKNKTEFPYKQMNWFPKVDGVPLQTFYLNFMPTRRILEDSLNITSGNYNMKVILYDKAYKFKNDGELWHRYEEWLDRRLLGNEELTRMEMSLKSKKKCSSVTGYFKKLKATGELIDESSLVGDIFKTFYSNAKKNSKRKTFRVYMKNGSLEPTLKHFFKSPKGSILSNLPSPKRAYKSTIKAYEEKIRKDLSPKQIKELAALLKFQSVL